MTKEQFIENLKKLNIYPTPLQLEQLEKYYNLLVVENQKYNLTAITTKDQVYLKHFYDSLTISQITNLNSQSLCDIGSGAGFPGLVLKIFFPNLEVTLVDSTQKKCEFLKLVITELNLSQITVVNERAEIYAHQVREKYDIVTSRAVAPLKHLLEYSIPLLKVNGTFIAMKANLKEELENIEKYEQLLYIQKINHLKFTLPIEESNRELICYQKQKPTHQKYPRKYNEIKKKSL